MNVFGLCFNQMVPSRDRSQYLAYRVRWWNIAVGVWVAVGLLICISPLLHKTYSQGLWGNIVASTISLMAASIGAWIFLNRFKAERLKHTMSLTGKGPVHDMWELSFALAQIALGGEPSKLRDALSEQTRMHLRTLSVGVLRKGVVYNRFLEIEQLKKIDECCEAAEMLALINTELADPKFMYTALQQIFDLYANSASLSIRRAPGLLRELLDASREWQSKERLI